MTDTTAHHEPVEHIGRVGVVPVVTIPDPHHAVALADALVTGGLSAIEITLRTPAGLEAIRRTAASGSDRVVGAGSVRSVNEAEAAIDAGARFLVSPGLDRQIVATAQDASIPIIPGIATATELMQAVDLGLGVVKVFPAEATGGVANVAALAAVFPHVRFMPTGGITPENATAYLRRTEVLAIGGSWMVPSNALADGDWRSITAAAIAAVDLVTAAR